MAISLAIVSNVPISVNMLVHGFAAFLFFGTNAIYAWLLTWLLYRLYELLRQGDKISYQHPLIMLQWKFAILFAEAGFYIGTPVCGMLLLAGSSNPIAATRGVQYSNMLSVAEYGTVSCALLWVSSLASDIRIIEAYLRGTTSSSQHAVDLGQGGSQGSLETGISKPLLIGNEGEPRGGGGGQAAA
jgi:hypothetical protein